jgi:hypothetical protein
MLNTRDEEIMIEIPEIKWDRYTLKCSDLKNPTTYVGVLNSVAEKWELNRKERVLARLTLDQLNSEEKRVIENASRDYQDIFYLKGDKLTCTNAIKHSTNVVPGTSPIHTRPCRLSEAEKREVDTQVSELLQDGITTQSKSPWCIPFLVIPKKKDDASGEKTWWLVVDFRTYPLPDITEVIDQLGQSKHFCCLDMVMGYHQGPDFDDVKICKKCSIK